MPFCQMIFVAFFSVIVGSVVLALLYSHLERLGKELRGVWQNLPKPVVGVLATAMIAGLAYGLFTAGPCDAAAGIDQGSHSFTICQK